MSFTKVINELKGSRENALSSKKAILAKEVDTNQTVTYLKSLLYEGILEIMQKYYDAVRLGTGRETTTPVMHTLNTSTWDNRFNLAVRTAGDGVDGLYPPDPASPSQGSKNLNLSSPWLTDNGLGLTATFSGRLETFFNSLLASIGTNASNASNGRGPFSSLGAAQSHRDSTKGSGLKGARTENSEIYTTVASVETPPGSGIYVDVTSWWVGENGVDNQDLYSGSLKTSLENNLSAVKTSLLNYKGKLDSIVIALNTPNPTLDEAMVELPDDVTYLEAEIINVQSRVDEIQAYLDYFIPLTNTNSGNRAYFDSQVDSLASWLTSVLGPLVSFSNTLPGRLGNPTSGFRKWMTFWIQQLVAKPSGPLITLNSMGTAKNDADLAVSNANTALGVISPSAETWLSTPLIYSAYFDPLLNENSEIEVSRITAIWRGPLCANKYKVLVKVFQEGDILEDTSWVGADEYWVVDLDPKTGLLKNSFSITSSADQILGFRIKAYDSNEGPAGEPRLDTLNSSSPLSEVFRDSVVYTLGTEGKIILNEPLETVYVGGFINFETQGILQVLAINGLTVTLSQEITSVQQANSMTCLAKAPI